MSKKKETKEERSERRRKELRLALRVFRYFLPYKWAMVVALLASAVVSGTTAGTAWLIKPALDDINIEIYPGEFVFLVGHSGSGKTTLLSTLNRDVKPTSGRILVAAQDLMKIKNRKVPFLRRQIGAVFQDFKLLPQKTAYENVAFALQCIGKPKGVIRSQVPEVLRLVGLADQMDSLPDQLSGGEQQRVAVARAMVNRPPLLICDEPTGNLDPAISLGIMKLLERINRTGTTVIVATHDREMVDSMHRRVIALEGGHVIRDQERGGYGNYGTN